MTTAAIAFACSGYIFRPAPFRNLKGFYIEEGQVGEKGGPI